MTSQLVPGVQGLSYSLPVAGLVYRLGGTDVYDDVRSDLGCFDSELIEDHEAAIFGAVVATGLRLFVVWWIP